MIDNFEREKKERIDLLGEQSQLQRDAFDFLSNAERYKYSYNFTWMGRPIIQYPQDIIAMQELIWELKPDAIIETGIARGGSIVFYASMLELIGKGEVLGIDIDIREHNRADIELHPMFKRISMIEGDSVSGQVMEQVAAFAEGKETVLVALDSNHTHEAVLKELELYSKFVTANSYIVVFDTVVEDMPSGFFADRPWDKGNNPKTAVWEFLKTHQEFEIDKSIQNKLLITVNPDGYLKRVR